MFGSRVRLSSPLLRYVAMAQDVAIIWTSGYIVFGIFESQIRHNAVPALYKMVMFAASLLLLVLSSGIYRSWRVNELLNMLLSVATGWLASVAFVLVWLFLDKSSAELSRVWFVGWVLLTLFVLCFQRAVVYLILRWLRIRGYNYKTVIIVGEGASSTQVQNALADAAWSGLRLSAILRPEQIHEFMSNAIEPPPDEVWICLPMDDRLGITSTLTALRFSTANIRLVPDYFAHRMLNHGLSEVMGITMLDLSATPVTGMVRVAKAVEDRILATFILVLISPLMLAIAIAIKVTSPGPVFYRQLRHGWNGEKISVYKFRSMTVHAEKDGKVTQAQKNDSRITSLGAVLRRTSLDELPQFINVLQGRMSIVGPRPHAVAHNDHYKELVPGYVLRHKVKPGITGWAQINGYRGETDTLDKMQKRVEYDIYYIENLSIFLDLKIILLTIFKGFVHRNAY